MPSAPECADLAILVSAYGDGELRCECERQRVIEHVRACLSCQQVLLENDWLANAMKTTAIPIPPGLKDRLITGLSGSRGEK
jgi:hypothetical protein